MAGETSAEPENGTGTEPRAGELFRLDDLSVRFPNGTRAVDRVSLSIARDEFVVIIGPSGAGKSTLIRVLNRLVTPTGGSVSFAGRDITRASGKRLRAVRQSVGMIFQQFNLVGRLSVIDNVLTGCLRFSGSPISWTGSLVRWFPRDARDRAMEALEQVGLAGLADQRADTLSGGQQQRVAIARLMLQQPEVILADEPIASLDPHSADVVLDRLAAIHRERGVPVLMNLHHVDLARRYATRIIAMRDGKVVFDAPPSELDESALDSTYRNPSHADHGNVQSPDRATIQPKPATAEPAPSPPTAPESRTAKEAAVR